MLTVVDVVVEIVVVVAVVDVVPVVVVDVVVPVVDVVVEIVVVVAVLVLTVTVVEGCISSGRRAGSGSCGNLRVVGLKSQVLMFVASAYMFCKYLCLLPVLISAAGLGACL